MKVGRSVILQARESERNYKKKSNFKGIHLGAGCLQAGEGNFARAGERLPKLASKHNFKVFNFGPNKAFSNFGPKKKI